MGNGNHETDKAGDNTHHAAPEQGHTTALHSDAYTPALNHRVINPDGTVAPGHCAAGPKLTDLTIDTVPGHVVVHDVPSRDATAAERREAAKREMPISNEHFRDLVHRGAEFMAINDGGFNIQMRNALNEANQSDKSMKSGHKHVDDVLKYVNGQLCGTDYTLRRHGNVVEIYDAHNDSKHPAGKWNLDKNNYER